MVSFLVETHIPQGDRDQFVAAVGGLRAALEAMNVRTHELVHVRSYLVPSDELGVHVVEADSVEAVRWLAKLAGIEEERIVVAVPVDPGGVMAWERDVVPRMER